MPSLLREQLVGEDAADRTRAELNKGGVRPDRQPTVLLALPAARCPLPAARYPLPATRYPLPATAALPPTGPTVVAGIVRRRATGPGGRTRIS
jgi:hypothetical protein